MARRVFLPAVEGHDQRSHVDGEATTPAHRRHGRHLSGRLHHAGSRTGRTRSAQQVPQKEQVGIAHDITIYTGL